ncbi:hypothetical protein BKA70DRAFT_1400968 [Coprinopsis sp. MPI-PUGE-AT-0042]|nr:hypothetical protein BKA70DRAFT_1400968 [Coprinopsis sp. MPI-PUGE-AT-0042]
MDLPFLLSMFIHKAEEEAMGIEPEATDGHRLEYDIPDSDGLDADVQMRDLEEEPGDVDMLDSRQRSGTMYGTVDAIDSWTTVHTDLTGRVDFSPRYLGSPLVFVAKCARAMAMSHTRKAEECNDQDQNQIQNNPPSRQGSPAGGHGDEEIGPEHPEFGIAFTFQIPPSFSRIEALEINSRLARARLLHQTGVPADVVVPEEEEEIPQMPGKRKRSKDLFALASLMSQASPGTRRTFENMLFPDLESKCTKVSGPKPPTVPILQSSGLSKPSHRASVLNDAFIAPYKDTLRLKHYIPLTAFLTSIIKAAAKSGKVEMQTIYVYSDNSSTMSKAYVMDASHFPDEEKMKFEQWIEAYSNFIRFLSEPGVACANTVDLFRAHFKILSTHPHAYSLFPAVIDIDMWYRRYILTISNEHPEAEYREQIATIDAAHRATRSISWQAGGNVASGSSATLTHTPDAPPPLLLLLIVTAQVAIVVEAVEVVAVVVEAFLPFRGRGSSSVSCVETNITSRAAQPRKPRKARPSLRSGIQAEYPALSNAQMELSSVLPGTSPITVTTPAAPTIILKPTSAVPTPTTRSRAPAPPLESSVTPPSLLKLELYACLM